MTGLRVPRAALLEAVRRNIMLGDVWVAASVAGRTDKSRGRPLHE
jgi:hypothetical protein